MRLRRIVFISAFIAYLNTHCAPGPEDFLFQEIEATPLPSQPVATTKQILIVTGQDANHAGVIAYELDGTPIKQITNFRAEGGIPKGIALFDLESFLVAIDTADAIYRVFFDGNKETFHGSALFTGNIFGLQYGGNDRYYAIETNNIEVFNSTGTRQTLEIIPTTTGSCTLSTPRGIALDSSGRLLVTNSGGTDNVLRYNISTLGAPATCVSSVAFGNDPYGIIEHSDGKLYVTTQLDDRVYRANPDGSGATAIWTANLALIRDPTAIVELPNGDLLIASSFTDTIERITTSGVRVGTQPFINDVFSLNVSDMRIITIEE